MWDCFLLKSRKPICIHNFRLGCWNTLRRRQKTRMYRLCYYPLSGSWPLLCHKASNTQYHDSSRDSPKAVPITYCRLERKVPNFVSRWLDVTKINIAFLPKGIILVEGIAEAMLLPVIAKRILDEHNQTSIGRSKLPSSLEEAGVLGNQYEWPLFQTFHATVLRY